MPRDVVVIGGGIVGASIAWHLTRAGARVTLLSDRPGGIATPNSFAWINASWGNPPDYFRLRMHSIGEWKRLAANVPSLPLSWRGGLCWDLPAAELLDYRKQHEAWGYELRQVDTDGALAIEPALAAPPSLALFATEEGVVEPQPAADILIADAIARGMTLVHGHASGLHRAGGRITAVETDHGLIEASEVVLAAGAETTRLANTAGVAVPIETPPGLLVHSKPTGHLLNGLVISPQLHVRQTKEGRVVAGTDFGGMDPGTDPDAAAAELFSNVRAFLKGGRELEFDFHTIGYRPTPKDGFPIIGRTDAVEGLYLAVTHSGVTLAPALGLFATREILEGANEPLLAPYRLGRFA